MKVGKIMTILILILSVQINADSKTLEQNKKLVLDFYKEVIVKRNLSAIDTYLVDNYIQHNPGVADGKEGLRKAIASWGPASKDAESGTEFVRVIAENDLVVLHVHIKNWPTARGTAVMDIFRVQDGKIHEHWDVIQHVPENPANSNTMF